MQRGRASPSGGAWYTNELHRRSSTSSCAPSAEPNSAAIPASRTVLVANDRTCAGHGASRCSARTGSPYRHTCSIGSRAHSAATVASSLGATAIASAKPPRSFISDHFGLETVLTAT